MAGTVSTTKTSDPHEEGAGHGGPVIPRAIGRWIGALFLGAFGLYGTGALLIEQATGPGAGVSEILASESQIRTGVVLVVANSIAVVAIGALMYRLAATAGRSVRLTYLAARVFEGILLVLTAVFGLATIAAAESGSTDLFGTLTEAGDGAYQVAMIGLCAGSIALFWSLARSQAMPRWLGLWGVVGYAIFGTGAALELFNVPAGVLMSIPGGIFEVTFGGYLLWTGGLGRSLEARGS